VPASEHIFCVPHADPGGSLIGRDAILEELDRRLNSGDGPTLLTALQGTGGIGKTQLAVRYCWARRRHHPGGIVWLNMADPARATTELVSWAEQLHLETTDTSDRAKANALIGCIRGRDDALVVLDNLEDPALLDRDLPGLVNSRPRGLGSKLLITSRQQVPDCQEIRLDFLTAPLDSALLLREAKRAPPAGEEAAALADLLSLLGGLPLALVMTGRLLADRPELTLASSRNALRQRGAISVLSERGRIPPDYHQKVGSSFRAVLSEIWDALPEAEPDPRRRVLTALALFGESAFVPEEVLPLMLELPAPDPDGFDPPPLEQALFQLEMAQLVERNRERGQLRLHPLIQDFARRRQRPESTAQVLADLVQALDTAKPILALSVDRLNEIARALDSLSKLHIEPPALAHLSRLLRLEATTLSLTANPISGTLDPAQLAYVVGLHGRSALKAEAEEAARNKGAPHLRLRWATAETWRSLRYRLEMEKPAYGGCTISSDGRTAFWDSQSLMRWDFAAGQGPRRLDFQDCFSKCVSADGSTLLCSTYSSSGSTLVVCDLVDGRRRQLGRQAHNYVISADGRSGLSVGFDHTLSVWDLATGQQRHQLRGHRNWVSTCAISADGQIGLSGSVDGTLIVWDLTTGQRQHHLQSHQTGVALCAVSANGLAGISASNVIPLIIVWDLATGQQRYRLAGHEDQIRALAVNADGRVGLSASRDGALILWDLIKGEERSRLRGHESEVSSCALSADGHAALSISRDHLLVWDLEGDREGAHPRGHGLEVRSCAVSADERFGLSASDDGNLIAWDVVKGEQRYRLHGHAGGVLSCGVTADGSVGLSASEDESLIVWDLATGEQDYRLLGHKDMVWSCGISADGAAGFSASRDRTLIVWDLRFRRERHYLHDHDITITCCAISASGRAGLSGSGDWILIAWDLEVGSERHRLRGHDGPISSCAISSDGRVGLSASHDQTLVVWDLTTGELRHRLHGHDGAVLSCSIGADGRIGVSTSTDQTLIVWDLTIGQSICRLALDSVGTAVSLSSKSLVLVGDRKGNVTCLELIGR